MKIIRYLPAFAWFATSFYLLTLPGNSLPKLNWFNAIHGDKLVHIGMFAILVTLFLIAVKQPVYKQLKAALFIGIASVLYGTIMEFVQGNYIPMRSFELADIGADAVGSFLPYFILVLTMKPGQAS